MIASSINHLYVTYCDVSSKVVDITKAVINKTSEVVKAIFATIERFFIGACIGAMGTLVYIIWNGPGIKLGYTTPSLNVRETAIASAIGALIVGLIFAIGID